MVSKTNNPPLQASGFSKLIGNLPTPDGHYLNLPVMNESGEIVGMVDVLKLTYATLEQVGHCGLSPTVLSSAIWKRKLNASMSDQYNAKQQRR